MTGSQTAHITVTCWDSGSEITGVYAVNEDISRELDRRIKKPAGKHLQAWLEKKGCRLDSSDGLAVVWHGTDGSTVETYYREGSRHREGGPAFVKRTADGSTCEEYYRDGKLHREDGPAFVKRTADGSTWEEYYRNGRLHREDGAASVKRTADGSTEAAHYRDGKLDRQDGPAVVAR